MRIGSLGTIAPSLHAWSPCVTCVFNVFPNKLSLSTKPWSFLRPLWPDVAIFKEQGVCDGDGDADYGEFGSFAHVRDSVRLPGLSPWRSCRLALNCCDSGGCCGLVDGDGDGRRVRSSTVSHQCHPPVVSPAGFAQVVRDQHLRDQGGFAGEHGLPVALPSGMMMMMVTRTRRMQRLQIAWGPGRAVH